MSDVLSFNGFVTASLKKEDSPFPFDYKEFSDRAINVKWFGAKGDGVTDDTAAIQNAIYSMKEGDTLLIPSGTYIIRNIIFNPPNYCNLICFGIFKTETKSGIIFQIGSDTERRYYYKIQGLSVVTPIKSWDSNVTGVRCVNIYASCIEIKKVEKFYTNILIEGTNNIGNSYNKYFIGVSYKGKKSLYLKASNGGWCNENSFYGGEFNYSSDDILDSECSLLTIEYNETHNLNQNHFYSPSFEGGTNPAIDIITIGGVANHIILARIESQGNIKLTSLSRANFINFSYITPSNNIIDEGLRNWIFTPSNISHKTDLKDKVISISTGAAETFYVKPSGQLFSRLNGYFERGIRFATSDLSFNDRGLFVGYGDPNGVVTANPGSIYLNRNGGTGSTLYVKESGAGNTGWVAK